MGATRRSFLSGALLLGGGAGAAWWLRDQVFWPVASLGPTAAGSSGWMPFANPRLSLPTVAAEVNGEIVAALLDSGAQTSVIDERLAERLALPRVVGPPLVAFGVGGQPQAGRGADLAVRLGGLSLERVRAAVLALGPLGAPEVGDTPVVLGQDVLSAVVAEIDFPRRRVRLEPAGSYSPPPEAVPAPVRRQGRALMARVTVEGAEIEVVVDTGASAVLSLSSEAAEAAGLLDGRPSRPAISLVLGGVSAGQVVTAEALSFAGETRQGAAVHVFQARSLPGFPRGLLGVEAMADHRVVLDHKGGRLLLAPG